MNTRWKAGHVRLGHVESRVTAHGVPSGPVVFFMPAFNEQATVGGCVSRVPRTVRGRAVEVVVVDDGSTDGTADAARAAGALVVTHGTNRGLGAAVRTGLRHGVDRGAAAVVFCDADGEYAPEEVGDLLDPILRGELDLVSGSRFTGRIEHMKVHRRLGNVLLTRALALVSGAPISDGQSGYRAFSREAAAAAEVVHDFNYAQVLTLDLLGKGFRYGEVPISYRFRTAGESFVRLGTYLRRVVPAVYRELTTGTDQVMGIGGPGGREDPGGPDPDGVPGSPASSTSAAGARNWES